MLIFVKNAQPKIVLLKSFICYPCHFEKKTDSVLMEANAALTEENRRLRFEVQDSLVRYQNQYSQIPNITSFGSYHSSGGSRISLSWRCQLQKSIIL